MIYHFFTPKSEEDIEAPESSESAKSEMRPFFAGVVFGVVFLLVLGAAYRGLANVYSQVTHQPISTEEKLNEIMQLLETHSINTYKEEELKENMYRGLLAGVGDPYTSYFDKKSLDSFMQSTEGSYAGIGVVVTTDPKDKLITVVSAYENAPGAMAGIIAGDKFLKINGLDVTNASLDDVTSMTKGQAGTSVKITIFRESENRQFDVNVVRKKIDIPTIASKSFDNIGYIQITAFDRVTLEQFKTAYAEFMETKKKGLIIDLRNNPGGLLDVVTKIADILAPEGIIVYTEDKNGKREYTYSDSNQIDCPLVLLVNGGSASASEVLSGCLKDMGVGILVGTKTFGKGIVQNLYPLSDGSAIKVTIAKYYTPSGVCIQGDGIIPDYVVELPDELSVKISTLTLNEDTQLKKGIEVLTTLINKQPDLRTAG